MLFPGFFEQEKIPLLKQLGIATYCTTLYYQNNGKFHKNPFAAIITVDFYKKGTPLLAVKPRTVLAT